MRDDAIIADEDEPAMDVVLPDTDEKLRREGWRLHVYRQHADGNVYVASERVLPEKVADERAHRVFDSRRICLHPDEVTWLYVKLGETLGREDEAVRLMGTIQRESAAVNEAHGVIAFLVGVLERLAACKTRDEAMTVHEMAKQSIAEWHAGLWKPGPHDDAANWKALP